VKKYGAGFIGTFSLVLFGCGAAVIAGTSRVGPSGIGLLGIAIAFGFAVVAMAYAIGVTLMLIHLVTIPVTGTSVNPARSLGPALLSGGKALAQLWLFIVAPIIGAFIAALVWRFGFDKE
jgi:aquaporin Z